MLLVRAADLPGLHDPDLGRDALPGVLARAHQGQDVRSPSSAAASVTQMLIAINVVVFLAETATGAPLGGVGAVRDRHPVRSRERSYGSFIVDRRHQYCRLLTVGLPARRLPPHPVQHVVPVLHRPDPGAGDRAASTSPPSTSRRCWPGRSARCCSSPRSPTVGASGAFFGILGRADRGRLLPRHLDLAERARADPGDQHRVLAERPGISIGGHIGGVVGGRSAAG